MRFARKLGVFLPPYLEGTGVLDSGLAIEIKGVEDERFVLRVKHAAKSLTGAASAVDIEYVGDIQLARAHEFANVAVGGQILFVIFELAVLIASSGGKLIDLRFQRGEMQERTITVGAKAGEFRLKNLIGLFCVAQLCGQFVAFFGDLPESRFPAIFFGREFTGMTVGDAQRGTQSGKIALLGGDLLLQTGY